MKTSNQNTTDHYGIRVLSPWSEKENARDQDEPSPRHMHQGKEKETVIKKK